MFTTDTFWPYSEDAAGANGSSDEKRDSTELLQQW